MLRKINVGGNLKFRCVYELGNKKVYIIYGSYDNIIYTCNSKFK